MPIDSSRKLIVPLYYQISIRTFLKVNKIGFSFIVRFRYVCSQKRGLLVHLVELVRICQNMQGKRRLPINITQSRQTVWRTCAGIPALFSIEYV